MLDGEYMKEPVIISFRKDGVNATTQYNHSRLEIK